MSEIAIQASGLSKLYRIGERRAHYKTLRDSLSRLAALPFRAARRRLRDRGAEAQAANTIWAVRDVSFEVPRGEVVGVIGRNGAGKSTLLKIFSRITEPTQGSATIHGRVGSLLEVGTGFHPELTGRENIFLNGAILGMRRAEIGRKLEEIVAFSEVEKFIDTPVKHYSSGMYFRLAFAVAAHLETEILLVDEVLAVGDFAFQKRCLGKMESVAAAGRTVLFVSHNLGAIKELCHTAIVLDAGRIAFRGPVVDGLAHYTGRLRASNSAPVRGTGWSSVRIVEGTEPSDEAVQSDQPFGVEGTLDVGDELKKARLFCVVEDSSGNGIMHNFVDQESIGAETLTAGRYLVRLGVPPLWLMPDVYTLYLKMIGTDASGIEKRHYSERVILNVTDRSGQSAGRVRATLIPPLKWEMSAHGDRMASEVAADRWGGA